MGITDLRQTSNYSLYLKKIGWKVEEIAGVNVFFRSVPLLGTYIKVQRPTEIIPARVLIDLANKIRVFSVVVEPSSDSQKEYYTSQFFKRAKTASLPSKTVWLDLAKSEKLLLSEMHYKTRYNIGLSIRRGVKIQKTTDINTFARYWQNSAKKRGMFLSQRKEIIKLYEAFGKDAELLYARYSGEAVAGIMLIHAPEVSYYMYAFSTPKGNKMFAPSLTAWEGILSAMKRKKKYFDFEGIYDERYPLSGWRGFTRFKKGFGGEIKIFPEPAERKFFRLW